MLTLSAAAKLEKNKLAAGGAWIILLDLVLVDGTHVRVCDNNVDVVWNGETWYAFPFELDIVTQSARGEIPTVTLRISNVSRVMGSYLEQGDGGIGATVTLRIVHSDHLDLATPELEETFDVIASTTDGQWATIILGAPNPLMSRFPRHRYLRDHCRWTYKSSSCGYTGALPTCDRNLADCRVHANSPRFGGFPGIPGGAIYRIGGGSV